MLRLESIHLFIVGVSSRALAQAAHEAGIACTVADCFCDADTQSFASVCTSVSKPHAPLRIDAAALTQALRECAARQLNIGAKLIVITSTGFEDHLDALRNLQTTAHELGAICAFNSAEVLDAVCDPTQFFAALDELNAEHPATQLEPPSKPDGWLIKKRGGYGASHIRPARDHHSQAHKHIYYQEYIQACGYSISANIYELLTVSLGFNYQLIDKLPDGGFRYAGAIMAPVAQHGLAQSTAQALAQLTHQLATRFKMRGLCSLDFLWRDGVAYVLELNVRPTASFELYGRVEALRMHLEAFGMSVKMPKAAAKQHACTGHRYVFAREDISFGVGHEQVLADTFLDAQISDRPALGSFIPKGAPLCNLHAEGASVAEVQAKLVQAEKRLLQSLSPTFSSDALLWKEAA